MRGGQCCEWGGSLVCMIGKKGGPRLGNGTGRYSVCNECLGEKGSQSRLTVRQCKRERKQKQEEM